MDQSIYNLEMHESVSVALNGLHAEHVVVTRVAGGWIYHYYPAPIFIPFSTEFKPDVTEFGIDIR